MGAKRRFVILHKDAAGYTAEGLINMLETRRNAGFSNEYLVVEIVETHRWYLNREGHIDRDDIRNHPTSRKEVPLA